MLSWHSVLEKNTNQSTDPSRSLLLSTKTEQTDPEVDSEIETLTTAVAGTHLFWSICLGPSITSAPSAVSVAASTCFIRLITRQIFLLTNWINFMCLDLVNYAWMGRSPKKLWWRLSSQANDVFSCRLNGPEICWHIGYRKQKEIYIIVSYNLISEHWPEILYAILGRNYSNNSLLPNFSDMSPCRLFTCE